MAILDCQELTPDDIASKVDRVREFAELDQAEYIFKRKE